MQSMNARSRLANTTCSQSSKSTHVAPYGRIPFRAHKVSARNQQCATKQIIAASVRLAPCRGMSQFASAVTAASSTEPLQLATAKLPKDVDVPSFQAKLYQWANALTTNSNNLPLALPLRIDSINAGFQMVLLLDAIVRRNMILGHPSPLNDNDAPPLVVHTFTRNHVAIASSGCEGSQMSMLRIRDDNRPTSVANISVTVEKEDAGNILFVRLEEGEGSEMVLPKGDTSGGKSYLQALAASLVDVSKIVNSMPPAIKLAVVQSRK